MNENAVKYSRLSAAIVMALIVGLILITGTVISENTGRGLAGALALSAIAFAVFHARRRR